MRHITGIKESMKKLVIIIFVLGLAGCDPRSNLNYKFKNSNGYDLSIYFYSKYESERDTFLLPENAVKTWREETDAGAPSKIDIEKIIDSIRIKASGKLIKTYVPSLAGKNIFDYSYWTESAEGKDTHVYTYTFTEDELGVSETEE